MESLNERDSHPQSSKHSEGTRQRGDEHAAAGVKHRAIVVPDIYHVITSPKGVICLERASDHGT